MKTENTKTITLIFNTTDDRQRGKVHELGLSLMLRENLNEVFASHTSGVTVHGPILPNNVELEGHPDEAKSFITFETDDLEAVKKKVAELVDVEFASSATYFFGLDG